jgi:hypothetical protein
MCESKQIYVDIYYVRLHEYLNDFTLFYFKLFNAFIIYTNLCKYILNLLENTHTAGLRHTAAPLDSRTLLCALPDSRTLPRALPHIA